jgi:hypothetical protein
MTGGTLMGSGTLRLGPSGNAVAGTGAKFSPGNGLGTLTLDLGGSGSFDLSGAVADPQSGALEFELADVASSDLLQVRGGALNIGLGGLEFDDFDFHALGGFDVGVYTLIDGDTPISGTFGSNSTGMINGMEATLALSDDDTDLVLLVGVPEPSAVLLLFSAGARLALYRFRPRTPRARA